MALVAIGFAVLGDRPSIAFAGMPEDERAYWSWVRSINEDPSSAIASGADLLIRYPHLDRLYLRFSDVCRGTEYESECRTVLEDADAPYRRTALYRSIALEQLRDSVQRERGRKAWLRVAASPEIDATLARLVVDRARNDESIEWLPLVEEIWSAQLTADSSLVGPAFGLGYTAVRRGEWDTGERLLGHALRLEPNEPHVYRELGRVYYSTGRHDKLIETLQKGIEAARVQNDLQEQLKLRGNLALGLLQWKGNIEEAEGVFQEALEQARLLSDGQAEGVNFFRLSGIRVTQNLYEEALTLLDSAEARYSRFMPQQRGELLALRGRVLAEMYRYSDSELVLEMAAEEASESGDVLSELQAQQALVRLRHNMGRYTEAAAVGLETLDLASRYRATEYVIATRILLGDVEVAAGNYDGAEVHFLAGLEAARQSESWSLMTSLYERLGLLALHLENPARADVYFSQLLQTVQQRGSSDDLVRAYRSIALMHGRIGNHEQAVTYFDTALDHVSTDSPRLLRSRVVRDKAVSVSHTGTLESAEALMHQAARLASGNRDEEYRVEALLADVYLRFGRYEDALEHCERAARLENDVQWSSRYWALLHRKALALWRLNRPEEAEEAFLEAIQIIEALRDHLSAAEDRASYAGTYAGVYESFAAFLEEQGRAREAFHYGERSRSRSLVDLLYTTQQVRDTEMDDPTGQALELHRRLRALDRELATIEQPAEETDGQSDVYRGNRAAFLRRERLRTDSLYRQVELDLYGENELYTFNPLQVDEVQATLRSDEALVVYDLRSFSDDAGVRDASVAYVVTRDTLVSRALTSLGADLDDAVRFFRDHVGDVGEGTNSGWEPISRRLYDELVGPVADAIPATVRHLHVIPEGVLHYLPFAALLDAEGRFLVERYTLSVVASSSILRLCRDRNPRRWSYMLLLADPEGRLPGARQEVRTIAEQSVGRRHVLAGSDATQEKFEELAGNYDVLHFATHGTFDNRAPWRSHLELADGVLSVDEIGQLRLSNVYLVTLSACETALSAGIASDVPPGDEWVGMNQAFLAAGAPTVLASLWDIDDRVSSRFMSGFYEALGAAGKAHALAVMQRRFIGDAGTRHPYYWAAFTVVGDPL